MTKILITGVAGFIGHALAKSLLNKNIFVIGIDHMSSFDIETSTLKSLRLAELRSFNNFIFIKEDINSISSHTMQVCKDCFAVIHLAANAGIKESKNKAKIYIQNNIIGFYNIIETAYKLGVEHFIYASSSSVYGDSSIVLDSHKSVSPKSIYAITKYTDELIAHLYTANYSLKTTGLRFFSVYGPYGRPDMAPWIFSKSIIQKKSFNLANSGYVYRDYTYIDDVIKAIEKVLFNSRSDKFAIYDIGASDPHSLLDLVKIIETVYGINACYNSIELTEEESSYTKANMDNFYKDYEIIPITLFNDGVTRFCNWYKSLIYKKKE